VTQFKSRDINLDVAALLLDMAAVSSESQRGFGYKRAARAILRLDRQLTPLVEAHTFRSVPGIGPTTDRIARELIYDGRSAFVEQAVRAAGKVDVVAKLRELRRHYLSRAAVQEVLSRRAAPSRKRYRGDLQMHSTWSDGKVSLEEMALACRDLGYEYIAVTDHSQDMAMVQGLTPERAREQWIEIDEIRERVDGIAILRSAEIDILKDGSLDMPDDIIEQLDVVVISVHSFMDQDRKTMTERVLRAMQHPCVDILAHPTGRRINRREPFQMDVESVLEAAADLGIAVELNANPNRLDLSDVHVHRAKELGIPVVISTDAHSPKGLEDMRFGVDQARRGWLGREDVLNTRSLEDFRTWLARRA